MLHVAGYAGLGIGLEGMLVLRQVFDSEGGPESGTLPEGGQTAKSPGDEEHPLDVPALLAQLRRERAGAPPAPDAFIPDWRAFMDRAFGDLWTRPGLTLAERERITIAVLIVIGPDRELGLHMRNASALGVPAREIGEEIMHFAIYGGFPAAVRALRVAREVLGQADPA
jgi:alkylhydroperoxidase/carboxymuconolactone decarboxylase family protein YurZ